MKGLAVLLAAVGLLVASVACGGDGSSQSASETQGAEGVIWVLQTMYGEPVIDGTFVWLRMDGEDYGGVDGCNQYGGGNRNGRAVASADGEFDAPPSHHTLILCQVPHGIMEQADRYRELLRQGERFRIEDDRLEILDGSGQVRLGFVRQGALAGGPANLVGTAWQLVTGDGADGDVKAATIVFLDDRHAVGDTACRGYVASYKASGRDFNSWESGMTGYGGSLLCPEESRMQEGRFTDDWSRAMEYSVSDEDGTKRLRIRTSRGRTVTLEPLAAGFKGVEGVEWHLTTILDAGNEDTDMPLARRMDRLIPGTDVTIRFHGEGASGFGGCNHYGARLEPEEPLAREDGTFAKGLMAITSTAKGCNDPPGVTEQEKRFTELIPQFERYRIYGELLVVHASEDVVLLFQR